MLWNEIFFGKLYNCEGNPQQISHILLILLIRLSAYNEAKHEGGFSMVNFIQHLPQPNPLLSPDDVVKIQLDALQNNDLMPNNEGIRFAFAYASPMNRQALGSLDDFIKLIKETVYRRMIGFERAELELMQIEGEMARQDVHLLKKNACFSYLFLLSRQHRDPFYGYWMTDAVLVKSE